MSTTIVIPEINSIRSNAMKFIIEKLGFNISPDEPIFDKKEKMWKVKCNAVISNFVSNKGSEGKNFVYFFNDIGEIIYKQEADGIKLISYPLRSKIDEIISNNFVSLTDKIEKELLKYGKHSWGKLYLLKNYLSPLYSIISNLVNEGHLSISTMKSEKDVKFLELLLQSKYIEIESDNKNSIIESNLLKGIKKEIYDKYGLVDVIDLTDYLVGNIFSDNYEILKYKFGIRPPSSYVDTTKAYYFDALRYGDLIKVTDREIFHSLKYFDGTSYKINDLNFKRSLLELANVSLIHNEDNYYYGDSEIYDKLYDYRNTLLTGAINYEGI